MWLTLFPQEVVIKWKKSFTSKCIVNFYNKRFASNLNILRSKLVSNFFNSLLLLCQFRFDERWNHARKDFDKNFKDTWPAGWFPRKDKIRRFMGLTNRKSGFQISVSWTWDQVMQRIQIKPWSETLHASIESKAFFWWHTYCRFELNLG